MRILVLGAGGPAGVNVCRALERAGHEVVGVDDNPLHLAWAEPFCAQVEMGPLTAAEIRALEPDLVHAQPEQQVRWLAEQDLPKLMPSPETIRDCQHKPTASAAWHAARLRRFPPVAISEPLPDLLHAAAETLGLPFWLRADTGAGARAATLVEDLRTGYHWIRYWATRGEEIGWVAEEYLPGHDFCWTSLWRDGILYASFARERLEWLYPHLAPSGLTGTPTIATVLHDQMVNLIAKAAVATINRAPNGIYCVDLREDRDGVPRPTEINAGRWATTSTLYTELGVNLPDLHARLAAGEEMEPLGDDIYPAGARLLRHIDCPTRLLAPVPA